MGPEYFRRIPSAKEFKKIGQHLMLATAILASSASSSDAQSTPRADSLSTISPFTNQQPRNMQVESSIILVSPNLSSDLDQVESTLTNLISVPIDINRNDMEIFDKAIKSAETIQENVRVEAKDSESQRQNPIRSNRETSEGIPDVMWDRLAQECESGGVWDANTGNGHFGGLQFNHDTWLGFGGAEFALRADLASRDKQIIVANRVAVTGYENIEPQGLKAWPVCSVLVGMRQP